MAPLVRRDARSSSSVRPNFVEPAQQQLAAIGVGSESSGEVCDCRAAGDGIGPEVTAQAVRVLEAVGERFGLRFTFASFPVGAAAVAVANDPLPPGTRAAVTHSMRCCSAR